VGTTSRGEFAESSLTSRQRKEIGAARALLGDTANVRAFATGRAEARWTDGASVMTGIFGAVFLVALFVFHVILFPGALFLFALYGMIRPRRGIAVTANGVTELALGIWNGRPCSVISTTDHAALFGPRATQNKGMTVVTFGGETVSLRDRDLAMLQSGVETAAPPAPVSDPWGLPPPPDTQTFGATQAGGKALPRWREATVLWVIAHSGITFVLYLGVIFGAFAIADVSGHDTTNPSPPAALMWLSFLATVAGWMCFVFYRGTRRTRLLMLAGLLGGGLAMASVAIIIGSPVLQLPGMIK
jgi:hypothetical protein